MYVFKAFKYRINPTKTQAELLGKHIGSVRFLYNLALETKQSAYSQKVNLSRYDLQRQLKDLKTDLTWLKEVNSQSLQVALMNLDAAYLSFFKGQTSFPRFKKKNTSGSFNIPQNVFLKNNKLIIPKFREGIDVVLHRPINGEIRNATITRTPTGKYFVSILCNTEDVKKKTKPIKERSTLGIDLGIKTFIVTSDGGRYDNPRFLKRSQEKLKFLQHKNSKYKGKRTKYKIALLHEKIANQRRDFLHKVSTRLIRENQSLAIETLQVSNMLKNHKLAQSIQDSGWGMFVNFLKYKSDWNGINILQIGTFDPSSKTCSSCGAINKNLKLSDREWTCSCGVTLDRDLNAAINIKNFSLKNHLSVGRRLKNQKELPTLVGVMTSEAMPNLKIGR